jgi:hypothetical protein
MAGRILNRRELRKQADEAETRESQQSREGADEDDEAGDAGEDEGEDEGPGGDTRDEGDEDEPQPAKKRPKAKPPAAKARKPKAAPRMRARWGVFDASMKQVAIFDFNQRPANATGFFAGVADRRVQGPLALVQAATGVLPAGPVRRAPQDVPRWADEHRPCGRSAVLPRLPEDGPDHLLDLLDARSGVHVVPLPSDSAAGGRS